MHIDTHNDQFCNCVARRRGLDPGGYAGHFRDAFAIEMPLPWTNNLLAEDWLPQEVQAVLQSWKQTYEANGVYPHRPLLIAPDEQYSREGYRHCLFYTQPDGLFAQYEPVHYLVPAAELGALVRAWFQHPQELPPFEAYTVASDARRDVFVCTHGTVDAACAKFGYPLYKHLRETYANDTLRVWRVSHFGGHVFAPTLMDMPTGHYWAYVDTPEKARQIIERSGDVTTLREHYRGWAGVSSGFVQVAERECWQQHGWQWFKYPKCGTVIAQDTNENPQWANVRLQWRLRGDSATTTQELRIEQTESLETYPKSSEERTRLYSQYRVREIS